MLDNLKKAMVIGADWYQRVTSSSYRNASRRVPFGWALVESSGEYRIGRPPLAQ